MGCTPSKFHHPRGGGPSVHQPTVSRAPDSHGPEFELDHSEDSQEEEEHQNHRVGVSSSQPNRHHLNPLGDRQEDIPPRNSSYATETYPRVDTSMVDPNLPEYVANFPEFMARHRDRVQRGRHDECRRDHVLSGLVMSEGGIGTYRAVEIPIGMLRGASDFRRHVDREIFGQAGKLWYLEFESMSKFDDWVREMADTYCGYRISFANLQLHLTEIDCLAKNGSLHSGGRAEEMQGRVAFQMTRWANIWWTLNGNDKIYKEEHWPSLFQSGVTFKAAPAPNPPIIAQRLRPAFEFNRSIPEDSGSGSFSLPPRLSHSTHLNPTFHHVLVPSRHVKLHYRDINGLRHAVKIPLPKEAYEFLRSVYERIFLRDGRQTLKFRTSFGEFVSWMEDAPSWISFTQLQIQVHEVMVKKLETAIQFSDILASATDISGEIVPKFDLKWSEQYDFHQRKIQLLSNFGYPNNPEAKIIEDTIGNMLSSWLKITMPIPASLFHSHGKGQPGTVVKETKEMEEPSRFISGCLPFNMMPPLGDFDGRL